MSVINCNINSSGLVLYYPFDKDLLNYATGTGVNDATISGPSISTAATVLSSGSIAFNGTSNRRWVTIVFC